MVVRRPPSMLLAAVKWGATTPTYVRDSHVLVEVLIGTPIEVIDSHAVVEVLVQPDAVLSESHVVVEVLIA